MITYANTPPPGHEERVEELAHRVSEELAREEAVNAPPPPDPESVTRYSHTTKRGDLPGNRKWNTLKCVNCRYCGRTLLGPSDEAVRTKAETMKCGPYLPPPVHRTFTRIYYAGMRPVPVVFCVCKSCS